MTLIIPVWAVVVLCVFFGIRVICKIVNSFRLASSLKSLAQLLYNSSLVKQFLNK